MSKFLHRKHTNMPWKENAPNGNKWENIWVKTGVNICDKMVRKSAEWNGVNILKTVKRKLTLKSKRVKTRLQLAIEKQSTSVNDKGKDVLISSMIYSGRHQSVRI